MKERVLTRTNPDGYIQIYLPDHHRASRQGYVLEHIVVAEKKYNRKITRQEAVHHIDRNRSNNHPDNLVVMTHSEHQKLHASEKGRKRKRTFTSVSSEPKEKRRYTGVKKDKLPRGYYYLRTTEKVRKTEKIKENA